MTDKINKPELEALINNQLNLKIKDDDLVSDCLDSLFKHIGNTIKNGNAVRLRGLGSFKASYRERRSVDPRNGEAKGMQTEQIIVFSPYKSMVRIHE